MLTRQNLLVNQAFAIEAGFRFVPWKHISLLYILLCLSIYSSFTFAQKSATKQLNFYLTNLISANKGIKRSNYEEVVYQKICPYMEGLRLIESKQKINQTARQRMLKEVIKIYDKVLNFSNEHYLMYCIYNYDSSTKSVNEFFKITKQILSPQKQKKFKDMWEICKKEDKEGNGDDPKILAKKEPAYLLSKESYKNMSSSLRLSYIKKIKKAFLQFELDIKNQSSKQKNLTAWLDWVIKPALAQFKYQCLIGGNMRSLVYSKVLKRMVCPIYGNSCGGSKKNFKCGPIFNNKCIPINPARSISNRCYQASQNEPINPEDYAKYKAVSDNIIKHYCVGRQVRRVGCINFMNRIKQINSSLEQNRLALEPKPLSFLNTVDTQTEANTVCRENCKPNPEEMSTIESIKKSITSNDISQYFLDTVFSNAKCECGGNNGCKRGCQPKGKIGRNQSPPVVPCSGQKAKRQPTGNCMRHVTGAIMSTIHQMLAIYCNDGSQNTKDYDQCMSDFTFPSQKNNLCQNGFVFPSALCALNLDGKSTADFRKIKNRTVRNKCKKWNKLNQSLTTFPIRQSDGTVKQVSLFKKIPLQGQDFQNNPDKIPEGAIVVMQSPNRNGHVEIKTDKNQCGYNKNQPCFCSDFCREREKYIKPFEVKAVFQWNPEIIEYAKQRK